MNPEVPSDEDVDWIHVARVRIGVQILRIGHRYETSNSIKSVKLPDQVSNYNIPTNDYVPWR